MIQLPQTGGVRDLRHRPQLDGARFLAIISVLAYHYLNFLQDPKTSFNIAVFISFFFVLSSFLITKILIVSKQKAHEAGYGKLKTGIGFLVRRTLRIFPAYYFYISLIMLMPVGGAYIREHAATFFLYLVNIKIYIDQTWGNFTAHLWTLAVEEQYYIVWPWLILFIPNRHLPKLFYSVIAGGILFRLIYFTSHPAAGMETVPMGILTPSCIDAFGIGGLLAYRHWEGKTSGATMGKLILFFLPVWFFLVVTNVQPLSITINTAFVSLMAAWALGGASIGYDNWFGRFLENRIVRYLAKISYGIYIYHLIAPLLFWKFFNQCALYFSRIGINIKGLVPIIQFPWVGFLVYTLVAILCAACSWHLLERPISRLSKYVTGPMPSGKNSRPGPITFAKHSKSANEGK